MSSIPSGVSSQPLASVAVITYNQERFISYTLESILAQKTDFSFEIIIGEDCSTDDTLNVCKSYESKFPGVIKVLHSVKNLGMFDNYFRTVSACSGKYIAQCAGDDFWHDPLKLQSQVDYLGSNESFGLVYSNYCILNDKDNTSVHDVLENDVHQNTTSTLLLYGNRIPALTVCFRKEIFEKIISPSEIKSYSSMEDYPMWLEFAFNSKIGYQNKSTATYRILENSLSHQKNKTKEFLFYKNVIEISEYFMNKYSVDTILARDILYRNLNTQLENSVAFQNHELARYCYNRLKKEFGDKTGFKHRSAVFASRNLVFKRLAKIVNKFS